MSDAENALTPDLLVTRARSAGDRKIEISLDTGAARAGVLGRGHFVPCPGLQQLGRTAAQDPLALDALAPILTRHRMAVIAGAPDVGKGTFARLVAARLSDASQPPIEVWERHALGSEIQAPLRQLVDGPTFQNGIWLFRNFLATRHSDLLLFVEELDEPRLASLCASLTRAQAYLLFTSDSNHLEERALDRLAGLGVLHVTRPPASDQMLKWLDLKVDLVVQPPRCAPEARPKAREIAQEHGVGIVARLRTPPGVVFFLDRYLLRIAAGEMTLERALERAEDRIDHQADGLLRDLASDVETGALLLALVLAQPVPPARGAPWVVVHDLAQALARHLRRLLRPPRGSSVVIEDEGRLDRLGAEVIRSSYPHWDVARFCDPSYPERYWRVLLGAGRELLSLLLPCLRQLAEDRGRSFETRRLAARALGRAGALDARAVTFPVLAEWSRAEGETDDFRLRGCLLQGALGGRPGEYGEACLRQIRRAIEAAAGEGAWGPALTLGTLGETELAVAIDGLALLAHASLGDLDLNLDRAEKDELHRFGEVFTAALEELEGQAEPPDLVAAILCRDETGAPLNALWAIQNAVVALCLFHRPLTPLRELARRLAVQDGGRLAGLPGLLLWRQGGIVDVLEGRYALPRSEGLAWGHSGQSVASRFLDAAASEPGGAADLAELLAGSSLQVRRLPGVFARYLQDRLRKRLRAWLLEIAATFPGGPPWEAGRTLFGVLRESRAAGLREDVRLLLSDPECTRPGSRVARLVAELALSPGEAREARPLSPSCP